MAYELLMRGRWWIQCRKATLKALKRFGEKMSTLLLSQSDVASVMKMAGAIDAVEEAFRATARGEALMPSKVYLDVEGVGDFRAMPALMGDSAGVKWVNSHPENR